MKMLTEKQPRLNEEIQIAVAENFAKMTPPKTNKELAELYEGGQIVKRRTKEKNQQSNRYEDVWHLPGAEDTMTFVQEIEETIANKIQETAVVIGTRFQMLLAEKIRNSGIPEDLIPKVRPTHQDIVAFLQRCIKDAVMKDEWPWKM
jgi:hypothetical protein